MVVVLDQLERLLAVMVRLCAWLVFPVVLALFLQWPLREVVHAYSREANDFGQICFALFVAASVAAASRAGTHLATEAIAARYSGRVRTVVALVATFVGPVPWALFLFWSGRGIVASIASIERFSDTDNPGYFLVKGALLLCTAMILLDAVVRVGRVAVGEPAMRRSDRPDTPA